MNICNAVTAHHQPHLKLSETWQCSLKKQCKRGAEKEIACSFFEPTIQIFFQKKAIQIESKGCCAPTTRSRSSCPCCVGVESRCVVSGVAGNWQAMSLDQKGGAGTNSGSSFLGGGEGVGVERDTNTAPSLFLCPNSNSPFVHRPSFS